MNHRIHFINHKTLPLQQLLLWLFICLLSHKAISQNKSYVFKGQVHAYGETLKGAKLEVYQAGDLILETVSKSGGKFEFELQSESEYMVDISKEEMRSKTIWINTKGTEKVKSKIPAFAFDVYLKKEKRTMYDELSEIPVTLIKYQPNKKIFYMDKTYESVIKNQKKRIKENSFRGGR